LANAQPFGSHLHSQRRQKDAHSPTLYPRVSSNTVLPEQRIKTCCQFFNVDSFMPRSTAENRLARA
jgi:hypothetical protein